MDKKDVVVEVGIQKITWTSGSKQQTAPQSAYLDIIILQSTAGAS